MEEHRMNSSSSVQGKVAGCSEHSSYIKCRKFLDWLRN